MVRLGINFLICLYISELSEEGPDIIRGVLASSINIESTSSITAKSREHCTLCSLDRAILSLK